MIEVLAKLVNADKLGGWVRAGVASGIAAGVAKWPVLGDVLGPEAQTALGVVAAGLVVGIWSQVTKSNAAKVSMVAALADDPASPVKGVVTENSQEGRALAASIPSSTVVSAGTTDAAKIAAK